MDEQYEPEEAAHFDRFLKWLMKKNPRMAQALAGEEPSPAPWSNWVPPPATPVGPGYVPASDAGKTDGFPSGMGPKIADATGNRLTTTRLNHDGTVSHYAHTPGPLPLQPELHNIDTTHMRLTEGQMQAAVAYAAQHGVTYEHARSWAFYSVPASAAAELASGVAKGGAFDRASHKASGLMDQPNSVGLTERQLMAAMEYMNTSGLSFTAAREWALKNVVA
jgi:hypothetical protein